MTDAPERIWAWRFTGEQVRGSWLVAKVSYADADYIRADIADRDTAEAVAAAYEAAASLAWSDTEDRPWEDYGETRNIRVAQTVSQEIADAIRALIPDDATATLGADKIKRLEWELRSYEQLGGDAERYAAIWREENPYGAENVGG